MKNNKVKKEKRFVKQQTDNFAESNIQLETENKNEQKVEKQINKEEVSIGETEGQTQVKGQNQGEETRTAKETQLNEEVVVASKVDQSINNEIETLKQQIAELNDKYLRLYSDYDNYRKRTMREKAELIKSAACDLILELLPVADDFERAIAAAEQTTDIQSVIQGIKLIQQKFIGVLSRNGIEEIKSIGEKFNTDFHEALKTTTVDNDAQKGTIVEEIQKGYLLNGKVIRHAKVSVGG